MSSKNRALTTPAYTNDLDKYRLAKLWRSRSTGGGGGTVGYEDGRWERSAMAAGGFALTNFNKTTQHLSPGGVANIPGNQGRSVGKRYLEIKWDSGSTFHSLVRHDFGITRTYPSSTGGSDSADAGFAYRRSGHLFVQNSVAAATGPALVAGDVVGIAVDFTTGNCWASVNGVFTQGDPAAGTGAVGAITLGGLYYPCLSCESGVTSFATLRVIANDFDYEVPAGFIAWGAY